MRSRSDLVDSRIFLPFVPQQFFSTPFAVIFHTRRDRIRERFSRTLAYRRWWKFRVGIDRVETAVHRKEKPLTSHRRTGPRGDHWPQKRNRPILAKKAYYVCRPLGLAAQRRSSSLACDEIFIGGLPGPYGIYTLMRNRTDTQSHESSSAGPTTRHSASNKSPQKREKVVGPQAAGTRGPSRRRDKPDSSIREIDSRLVIT